MENDLKACREAEVDKLTTSELGLLGEKTVRVIDAAIPTNDIPILIEMTSLQTRIFIAVKYAEGV